MPIQAVLFDLFNTLIMVRDGDAFYMPALKQLHKTLTRNNINIPFDDFKHEYFQVRDKLYTKAETNLEEPHFNIRISQTLQNFNINLPPEHPTIAKATNTFCKEFTKHTSLDPDAKTVLSRLSKKYKLGIVSNFAIPECAHRLLKQHRIDRHFQTVIISAAINKRKPSPKIFQKALQTLNVQPSNAMFIGDTPDADIQGAKNAGMKAILIKRPPLPEDTPQPTSRTQEQTPNAQPNHTIQRLTELPSILQQH
jgi:putative hydrolase of the HAD superfamily